MFTRSPSCPISVVTGGAGFLGSHLTDKLLSEGHRVIGIDNFLTGSTANIEHLAGNDNYRFIKHDVSNHIFLPDDVDYIFHFASPASPVDYLLHPIPTLKVGSLGTLNSLGLAKAKGACFLIASTSECYGDPLVHPQREDYWGNVNPIGIRGCYDESKRFAEAMVMAYHRAHGVDTRLIRIFNSVLGDQPVLAFHDGELVLETADDYAARLEKRTPTSVSVPAFDPACGAFGLSEASAFIKHPAMNDAFELSLRYGRRLKVTGDHSVFVRGSDGRPAARPVRALKEGDYVAIPATLPVVERDRPAVDIAAEVVRSRTSEEDLWGWMVRHPDVPALLRARRQDVYAFLREAGRYRAPRGRNLQTGLANITGRWIRERCVPLAVLHRLGETPPEGAEVKPAGGRRFIPARVTLTDDILWLLGFFLAEGCTYEQSGEHLLTLSSDELYLRRAAAIIKTAFGGEVGFTAPTPERAPSVRVNCRALCVLVDRILGFAPRRVPGWVMQLPLSRLKHFLEGFRCGDGTHSGKKVGNELCFDTTREPLAVDLTYLLLRFGIVASVGRYETTFRQKYGDRKFPFFRLTVCALDDFDVLEWDKGVKQTLNAARYGDLVWAKVREIRPCVLTGHVYDFSVPGAENFVAGNGVCAHNTYGSRMRLDDGRVLPNFVGQALRGEPLTVYGDGSQTRSFCYVEDLVDGIEKLLEIEYHDPVNLGNPDEVTILEFAREILALSGSKSEVVFRALPQDDPKVRRPDISRARELLGWEPRVPREEGLRRTLAYFQGKIAP